MAGGKSAFRSAETWAAKSEADYWLGNANLAAAANADNARFRYTQEALGPNISSGHFHVIDSHSMLTTGIRASVNHGHTPSHTSLLKREPITPVIPIPANYVPLG